MLIVRGERTVPRVRTSNLSSFVLMFTALLKTLTTVPNVPSLEKVMFLCMLPRHLQVVNIVGDSEGISAIYSLFSKRSSSSPFIRLLKDLVKKVFSFFIKFGRRIPIYINNFDILEF